MNLYIYLVIPLDDLPEREVGFGFGLVDQHKRVKPTFLKVERTIILLKSIKFFQILQKTEYEHSIIYVDNAYSSLHKGDHNFIFVFVFFCLKYLYILNVNVKKVIVLLNPYRFFTYHTRYRLAWLILNKLCCRTSSWSRTRTSTGSWPRPGSSG